MVPFFLPEGARSCRGMLGDIREQCDVCGGTISSALAIPGSVT